MFRKQDGGIRVCSRKTVLNRNVFLTIPIKHILIHVGTFSIGVKMKSVSQSKIRGALLGLGIGDALSMPVHWYYNRWALENDYGQVVDYLKPRNPHPDSILWRSQYKASIARGEILHDQARYWGKRSLHYHQFLKAGENTLNVKICRLLVDSLNQNRAYDGNPLQEVILGQLQVQNNPLLGHPFTKLLKEPDETVIGKYFSTACYVEDAVPAVIYLALKYHQDPEKALTVNTNLGGDNAGRGAVLGALLGAAHGTEKFPEHWVGGLVEPLPDFIKVF